MMMEVDVCVCVGGGGVSDVNWTCRDERRGEIGTRSNLSSLSSPYWSSKILFIGFTSQRTLPAALIDAGGVAMATGMRFPISDFGRRVSPSGLLGPPNGCVSICPFCVHMGAVMICSWLPPTWRVNQAAWRLSRVHIVPQHQWSVSLWSSWKTFWQVSDATSCQKTRKVSQNKPKKYVYSSTYVPQFYKMIVSWSLMSSTKFC